MKKEDIGNAIAVLAMPFGLDGRYQPCRVIAVTGPDRDGEYAAAVCARPNGLLGVFGEAFLAPPDPEGVVEAAMRRDELKNAANLYPIEEEAEKVAKILAAAHPDLAVSVEDIVSGAEKAKDEALKLMTVHAPSA